MAAFVAASPWLRLTLLGLSLLSLAWSDPARNPETTPLRNTELLGFDASGRAVFREMARGQPYLLRLRLPDGEPERLKEPPANQGTKALQRGLGLEPATSPAGPPWVLSKGLTLSVKRSPSLGDRPRLTISMHRGDETLLLRTLPVADTEPSAGPLFVSPDGEDLLLALGHGPERGLELIRRRPAEASLLNLAAIRSVRAGRLREAEALLLEAQSLAPALGEATYNLACVHARLGELDRAKSELLVALAVQRLRFAKLALTDPDLEPLRRSPEIWAEIEPSLGSRGRD